MMDHCAECGQPFQIGKLDAKPEPTFWLVLVRLVLGQRRMLSYAAAQGYDFERLECRDCYGPDFSEGQP